MNNFDEWNPIFLWEIAKTHVEKAQKPIFLARKTHSWHTFLHTFTFLHKKLFFALERKICNKHTRSSYKTLFFDDILALFNNI